jgi:acetyltransferase-like isoleucine patch superfamily enzyme
VTRRHDIAGEWIRRSWEAIGRWGAIGPESRTGKRFGRFGAGSIICFPTNTVFNERYIHIGEGTMIGPNITLSAGMVPSPMWM